MSSGLFALDEPLIPFKERDLINLKARDIYGKAVELNSVRDEMNGQSTHVHGGAGIASLSVSTVKRNTYESLWTGDPPKGSKRVQISPKVSMIKSILQMQDH